MLHHAMVDEMPDGLSVQPPPPPRKIGHPVKIAFWQFLFTVFSLHVAYFIPGCMLMFKMGKGSP